MRTHKRLILALGLALVAAVVSVQSAHNSSEYEDDSIVDRRKAAAGSQQLPKLFDFEHYKKLFKKSYPGLAENLVRGKLFMARALRVFISATKYRFRYETYYLALNHMSDLSRAELDMMRNRVLEAHLAEKLLKSGELAAADAEQDAAAPDEQSAGGKLDDTIRAFEALRQKLEAHKDKPGYEELRQELEEISSRLPGDQVPPKGRRRKRSVDARKAKMMKPRDLPADKLINTGEGIELAPAAKAKIPIHVTGKNLNYERLELMSQGLVDQQVRVDHHVLGPEESLIDIVGDQLENFSLTVSAKFGGSLEPTEPATSSSSDENGQEGEENYGEGGNKPDKVFSDLRDSNCFFMPRRQGVCGACYAFSALALAEYLHCRKTGQLLAFSEQYLIDCGTEYFESLFMGCKGGYSRWAPIFFHNFGMELRAIYPYYQKKLECPLDKRHDLTKTGYIRMDIKNTVEIDQIHWPEVLKYQPLMLTVFTTSDFGEYGGGVSGWGCKVKDTAHAMLVIGHGREDGHEYWLIRNSYGIGWGEAGYWKLAKEAGCIMDNVGHTMGTLNGKSAIFDAAKNARYYGDPVKRHYFNHMKIDI